MANVKTLNKELVNKLCSIIKGYDPYTAYIEDYKQYSNAVDNNCKLDQQFIHTCKEYGYDVEVSFCYSLAKSLANGKFDSAEETVIDYINSLTKEDDSILSSPNTTPETIDNANKEEIAMKKNTNINNVTTEVKEESTMTNEMIKDEVKVVSTTLTQENGELTFVELSPEQKIQISAVLDAQLQDVNYSSWFEEENGVFKLYGSWVDEDSAVKEEYYFNGNKLIKIEKEESIMKDDNTTVSINSETTVEEREETTMTNNTNNTKTINFTTKKEVITMTNEMIKKLDTLNRTMQLVQVLEWCDNIKNVHDVYYVKKDVLAQFLFNKDLISRQLSKKELKRIKRDELIANLREAVGNLREAGIITPTTPVAKVVSVGDFCRDNAPVEIIEEPTFELNQDMASKILEKVIRQADTNKAHNFISNWMLTSAISEVLFGVPLKEKRNGEIIEHWKNFSKEQNTTLAYIHKEFVCKSGLVAKRKDGTIVGYTIPAKVLVWGRHKYLNKTCVYKVVDKYGKPLAEYLVSVNGIKNTATGKMIPLTADDYNTLDTKCVFIR